MPAVHTLLGGGHGPKKLQASVATAAKATFQGQQQQQQQQQLQQAARQEGWTFPQGVAGASPQGGGAPSMRSRNVDALRAMNLLPGRISEERPSSVAGDE